MLTRELLEKITMYNVWTVVSKDLAVWIRICCIERFIQELPLKGSLYDFGGFHPEICCLEGAQTFHIGLL
jgi:hypothetical protein